MVDQSEGLEIRDLLFLALIGNKGKTNQEQGKKMTKFVSHNGQWPENFKVFFLK
jgi:hypothetical protein